MFGEGVPGTVDQVLFETLWGAFRDWATET